MQIMLNRLRKGMCSAGQTQVKVRIVLNRLGKCTGSARQAQKVSMSANSRFQSEISPKNIVGEQDFFLNVKTHFLHF